jgi:hypothetical protein
MIGATTAADVEFARDSLRWRKRDSNPRSHLKEQPAELHLFDLRCSSEHCPGAARRSWGHAPDEVGPRVRIPFAPAASQVRTGLPLPGAPAPCEHSNSTLDALAIRAPRPASGGVEALKPDVSGLHDSMQDAIADVGITETLAPGLLGRQRGTGPRTDEGLVNTLNDAEQEDAGEKLPVAMNDTCGCAAAGRRVGERKGARRYGDRAQLATLSAGGPRRRSAAG